jgi:hypothetical protein
MPLTRSLNRPLFRPVARFLDRRLDGRSVRRTNYLAEACALLGKYIRLRRKSAKAEPHLFGPHAGAYYRDTLRLADQQKVVAAALDKIYGPDPSGAPPPPSVWSERYDLPPEQMKVHRQWFRENYGA